MGRERSASKICGRFVTGLVLLCLARFSLGVTNPDDVDAINSLFVSLNSPLIPGWVATGGDPCGEKWQGVECIDNNISRVVMNAANLGGELGDNLKMFTAIRGIDLSNNHIGGSIPSNLPVTLQTLFLSANQFTGSIPESLSNLLLLSDMSLNDNLLSGELPDAFGSLTGLINLDVSSNNLSGELPASFGSLSSLTTLRLQSNQLSGTLDVLQDLPLKDLNVENNLFSGPIPEKMLSIPNFKKEGYNFTASPLPAPLSPSTLPSPPTLSPPIPGTPSSGTPTSRKTPPKQADGPSISEPSSSGSGSGGTKKNVKKVVLISIASAISLIVLILALLLFIPRCARRRREPDRVSKRHRIGAYQGDRENPPPLENTNLIQHTAQAQKAPKKEVIIRPKENQPTETRRLGAIPKTQNEREINEEKLPAIPKKEDHKINFGVLDEFLMPPPPPPPPPLPPVANPPPPPPPQQPLPPQQSLAGKVIVEPLVPFEIPPTKPSTKSRNPNTNAKFFSIASLQQYTNSFSQDNCIGGGTLGSVYRAQLPDGKLLAVKKLDKRALSQQKEEEFVDLVNNIDRIRHANVVELMGYCSEHGQRLLINEYCSNGSLQDALHSDDDFKRKLSWNSRIKMALGAARALEYLHEVCDPPVVHRNFKSANVLLDEDLSVRVSDCGLSPLISSGSVSQLSGHLLSAYGYGAPEFESGIYTYQSDIYSFGVVMLELLTGRKSYDRDRTRGEQFLIRWAIPQLHDIDALSRMVDPSLNGNYPAKSLSHFADIISRCVQSEPEFRPPMSEVVQDLLDMIRREPQGSGSNED